jgi:ABC-type uncharacterized transport system substrate-binding protein
MQFGQLKRREFITLFVGASAWPFVGRAQSSRKLRTIGFLVSGAPASHRAWFGALAERLRELGWIENRNINIEYRWAEGRPELYTEIANEFVRMNVDVIVALGAGRVLAAKRATTTIPIVFPASGDPVGTGLVQRILKIDIAPVDIRRAEELAPGFASLKEADALYIIADPLLNTNRVRINTLALTARLPTMFSFRENVEAGGLMSYGPNWTDLFRRAAEFVDSILRGAKPADIPVEQPTNFSLVINSTTAKVLGLTLPSNLLARAEVIE